MKIMTIFERIITGRKVKFNEAYITEGPHTENKVIIVKDLENGNKFVLGASIYNYIRFKDWVGKEAEADYEINKHNLIITNKGKFVTGTMSTEVEVEKKHYKKVYRNRFYKGDDYDI
jgi:hypothetical protein